MTINKEQFLGYIFLIISIFINIIFLYLKDFDYKVNNDAYWYLEGYNYLLKNPFDSYGNFSFGRFPEYIYDYLFSIIAIFIGPIKSINDFMLITSIPTYLLLIYCYVQLPKKFFQMGGEEMQGVLLQLLSVLLPLGLTIQTSRQAFALYLFLSLVLITKPLFLFGRFFSYYVLLSTHVSSGLIIFFEYLVRNKKFILFNVYTILCFFLIPILVLSITNIKEINMFRWSEYGNFNKYLILTLLTIIYLKGKNIFFDKKYILLLCSSLLIVVASPNAIIIRILFGFSWLWLILAIWPYLVIENKEKLKFRVKIVGITVIIFKIITLF